ncbi:MAG: hypothetical protein ABIH36_03010 [bacterium]
MKDLSTGLLVCALILLPLIAWSEARDLKSWNNRLVIPYLTSQPDRHTQKHTAGTTLPPVINEDLILTPANNPVLLTATTRINAGATLSLSPGTAIYAHEFSGIIIEGKLVAQGLKDEPILFTSNELHPLNQTWNGLIVTGEGQATITHAIFHYASPALTCLADSNTTLNSSYITDASLGIFTDSSACHIKDSRINSIRDGIISIGLEPQILDTAINALHNKTTYVRTF